MQWCYIRSGLSSNNLNFHRARLMSYVDLRLMQTRDLGTTLMGWPLPNCRCLSKCKGIGRQTVFVWSVLLVILRSVVWFPSHLRNGPNDEWSDRTQTSVVYRLLFVSSNVSILRKRELPPSSVRKMRARFMEIDFHHCLDCSLDNRTMIAEEIKLAFWNRFPIECSPMCLGLWRSNFLQVIFSIAHA